MKKLKPATTNLKFNQEENPMSFIPKFGENQNIVLFYQPDTEEKKRNRRPDYTGFIRVNGEVHEVSLWGHYSKKGNRVLSGKFKEEPQKD